MTDENNKNDAAEAQEEQSTLEEQTPEEATDAPADEPKEDTPAEAPATDEGDAGDDEPVEVPEKFAKLVEQVEQMSVLDLHELVGVLEKKFGVSAAAVAAAPAGGDAGGAEEKDSFTVELASAGDSKIGVIKAVKAALGLGLKEAKDLVDSAPAVLKEGVKKDDAEALKSAVEEAGGKVELK